MMSVTDFVKAGLFRSKAKGRSPSVRTELLLIPDTHIILLFNSEIER